MCVAGLSAHLEGHLQPLRIASSWLWSKVVSSPDSTCSGERGDGGRTDDGQRGSSEGEGRSHWRKTSKPRLHSSTSPASLRTSASSPSHTQTRDAFSSAHLPLTITNQQLLLRGKRFQMPVASLIFRNISTSLVRWSYSRRHPADLKISQNISMRKATARIWNYEDQLAPQSPRSSPAFTHHLGPIPNPRKSPSSVQFSPSVPFSLPLQGRIAVASG